MIIINDLTEEEALDIEQILLKQIEYGVLESYSFPPYIKVEVLIID